MCGSFYYIIVLIIIIIINIIILPAVYISFFINIKKTNIIGITSNFNDRVICYFVKKKKKLKKYDELNSLNFSIIILN